MDKLVTATYHLIDEVNWKKWGWSIIIIAGTLIVLGSLTDGIWSYLPLMIGNIMLIAFFVKIGFEMLLAFWAANITGIKQRGHIMPLIFLIAYPLTAIAIGILKLTGVEIYILFPLLWLIPSITAIFAE